MRVQYTKLKLDWNDAIDYAFNRGLFLPSKEQAEDLGLPKGFWTSTTDNEYNTRAWVTREKYTAIKFVTLKRVVLVKQLVSEQKISYRVGDINEIIFKKLT